MMSTIHMHRTLTAADIARGLPAYVISHKYVAHPMLIQSPDVRQLSLD